jgi:hypothetical protein
VQEDEGVILRSPELMTVDRRDLREAFGESQRLASKKESQSSGTVYFNADIMLQGPEYPRSFLRENVEKFAAEHFFKATSRLAYFDGNEWFHPDGQSYKGFFRRATEYHKDSPKLLRRFEAEERGYDNGGVLVNTSLREQLPLPEFAIVSSPGDVYQNEAFKSRDVYFFARPICQRALQLGDRPTTTYSEYEMLVVPGEETDTKTQWDTVAMASDLETSLRMLHLTSEMIDANDANFAVATPLLLENIELLATKLGYEGVGGIKNEASKMLELDQDPTAEKRRTEMIDYFTDKIWFYVSRRDELTDQDKLKLRAWTDIMHDYLSAEGGSEYKGQEFAAVKSLIEGHTKVHQKRMGVTFTSQEMKNTDWEDAEAAYHDYFRRLQLNKVTQERRNNAGCPVKIGGQDTLDFRGDFFENSTDLFGYETSMTDIFSATYTEPTSTMECVQCPFCHKTVDAILTSDKIKCPECKAEVSRS